MALWSLFVTVGKENYSTQVVADSPREVIRRFLRTVSLKETLRQLRSSGWPVQFSLSDVILLVPMDGLVNMYLCQIGREGKYVSVIMARTVSRKYV